MEILKFNTFSITTSTHEISDYLESIFYQGNGYMGARGFPCEDDSDRPYQKGIYMAGVYEFLKENITDMVNMPNFLKLNVSINNEEQPFCQSDISNFTQCLCFSDAVLSREYLLHSGEQELHVKISRFFSLKDVHIAAIRLELTPVNFSGKITCVSSLDTSSCNLPINDDQVKKNTHLYRYTQILSQTSTEKGGFIEFETKTTRIAIVEAFALQYSRNIEATSATRTNESGIERIDTFDIKKNETYRLDKIISVFTSRDTDRSHLADTALEQINKSCVQGYDKLLDENRREWLERWNTSDIEIQGDLKAQSAIRYNIFQLICNNSRQDDHVSIGARGLTHPRYKGCYFWDTEIFILPFFVHTDPLSARNLLKYRYNTLRAAKEHSRKMSTQGARFPWMTSFDGSEQCESWDTGACELHITCDIAYAYDKYIRTTGDIDFLIDHAAEVYIESARFWASRYTYDSQKDAYNLLFVKGPDEYCGVSHNNTYTVYLSRYNLQLAIKAIKYLGDAHPQSLQSLYQKIEFDENEIDKWLDIISKIKINYIEECKLFVQDDTFMLLEPLEIQKHKKDNIPLYHKISFDRLQRYQVLKQADIILLMALMPNDFTDEQKKTAWDYYEPLTLHDSTLSFGTHSLFGAQINQKEKASEYLEKSLYLDLDNVMKNTGNEGLHIAALGATWQAIIFGFAGVSYNNGQIRVNPRLPKQWKHISFTLFINGERVHFSIGNDHWETKNIKQTEIL